MVGSLCFQHLDTVFWLVVKCSWIFPSLRMDAVSKFTCLVQCLELSRERLPPMDEGDVHPMHGFPPVPWQNDIVLPIFCMTEGSWCTMPQERVVYFTFMRSWSLMAQGSVSWWQRRRLSRFHATSWYVRILSSWHFLIVMTAKILLVS